MKENSFPYFVAELNSSHFGNLDYAKDMITEAKNAGADCVKFQMRDMKELYSKEALNMTAGDLSTQYTINLLNKFQLSFTDYKNLIVFMGKNGKQLIEESIKNWEFEYKEKESLTNKDSFLINIKNIKKK